MLTPPLTDVEVRVLGALLEKAVTTPDYYPLSISAVVAACNQLSNRDPVMQLDEGATLQALTTLRRRSFVRAIQPSGSRVTKYMHLLDEALLLDVRERAVLCVLMLRGEQTLGELHARTARLADFPDLSALEATLDALIARSPESLAVRLPRRPGQKEVRYAQLLAGDVVVTESASTASRPVAEQGGGAQRLGNAEPLRAHGPALHVELSSLREECHALRAELAALRDDCAALRAQFDDFREQFR